MSSRTRHILQDTKRRNLLKRVDKQLSHRVTNTTSDQEQTATTSASPPPLPVTQYIGSPPSSQCERIAINPPSSSPCHTIRRLTVSFSMRKNSNQSSLLHIQKNSRPRYSLCLERGVSEGHQSTHWLPSLNEIKASTN